MVSSRSPVIEFLPPSLLLLRACEETPDETRRLRHLAALELHGVLKRRPTQAETNLYLRRCFARLRSFGGFDAKVRFLTACAWPPSQD